MNKRESPSPAEIKALRKKTGWNKTVSAANLHVTLATYSRWESGQAKMHPHTWDCFVLQAHGIIPAPLPAERPLGSKVTAARLEAGLNKKEAAAVVYVDDATWHAYERTPDSQAMSVAAWILFLLKTGLPRNF